MVVGGLNAQLMNAGSADRVGPTSRERQPLAGQLPTSRAESPLFAGRSPEKAKPKEQDFASSLRRQSEDSSRNSSPQRETGDASRSRRPHDIASSLRPSPSSKSNVKPPTAQDDAPLASPLRRDEIGIAKVSPYLGSPNSASEVSPEFERAVEEVVSKMSELSEDETELRAEAMREFMIVMNREFGVEPEQMVKAYTQLSEAELTASPDQTAKQVIQNLGLEPAQIPRAERLYREMLVKTGESMLQEKLAGAAGLVALDVISRREMAAQQLESSISDLNAAFSQPQRMSGPLSGRASNQGVLAKDEANQAYLDRLMMGMAAAGGVGASQGADLKVAEMASELQASNVASPTSNPIATRPAVTSDLMTEMLKLRSQNSIPEMSPTMSSSSESGNGVGDATALASTLGLSAMAGLASSSENRDSNSSGQDSQGRDVSIDQSWDVGGRGASDSIGREFSDTLQVKSNSSEKLATALGTTGGMLATNTSEQRSNGPELMRQAQLLVNQGGGEMKMQLRPEGLGEVHLKVKVENGQVQIQMLTESDSAKKAIEGSLDELRSGLAQNKLHVDAMKIEVGTDLAKQRFEQQQQESQRDQARQMAQNFMGQFREGRQGFHQSLGENRGWREYRPSRVADAPTADAVVSASSSARAASASRRLDLVA